MEGETKTLFTLGGFHIDLPLLLSLIGVLLIGILQLSWPAIQAYFTAPAEVRELPEMPVIETISEDPVKEKPRRRFVKDKADIASWATQEPASDLEKYRDTAEGVMQDPNTILPAGLERMDRKNIKVDENGKILDVDGSVIEDGTIAYIRQQIIDRVINTGAVAQDVTESAEMKLDIIKSVRQLSDLEVVEWYLENKEMLTY